MRNPFCFRITFILCLYSIGFAQGLTGIQPVNSHFFNKHDISSEDDSLITSLIVQVNADSIKNCMLKLEGFNTRYYSAGNRDTVVRWITGKFKGYGFTDITVDSFLFNGVWCKNIIASMPSSLYQNGVIIAGAHYDSYGQPTFPGTDDNASGTAAVLEMARILKKSGFMPLRQIRFITFAAEEQGLLGSADLAGKYRNSGQSISLMINLDMIANSAYSENTAYIHSYRGDETFQGLAGYISAKYAGLKTLYNYDPGKSDSYSFHLYGYPSLYFEEYEHHYRFHSPNDSVSYCNMAYAAVITRAAFASLLYNSFLPSVISKLTINNLGDGKSIRLKWTKNNDPDPCSYKVSIGRSSMNYDSSFTTLDTSTVISGLKEDSLYYFAVSAISNRNLESVVVEKSITASQIPVTPKDFIDNPGKDRIVLNWTRNTEEDLSGCNLYRSVDSSFGFVKINSSALKDTIFLDENVADTSYFYFITAIDDKGNESKRSNIIKSHAVTLSHGILIVDDSADEYSDGLNYNDTQVDSFYVSLLQGRKWSSCDLEVQKDLKLSDLGPYSTVIWHRDIYSNNLKNFDVLKKYLNFGGNFLFSGLKVSDFKPDYLYPNSIEYTENDFIYKYLKVRHIDNAAVSNFIGALPEGSTYIPVAVDAGKTKYGFLNAIETMQPAPGGNVIFRYDSKYNSDPLKGKPVGIEYIGSDYKVIVLSFPLFFIRHDEARNLISYILDSKFNQETAVNDNCSSVIKNYRLYQNYPNPFNPVTVIKYDIPKFSFVEIKIYDILGRIIATLFSGYRLPGTYDIKFDGGNLPSGIYIYKIQCGDYTETKKMTLMK